MSISLLLNLPPYDKTVKKMIKRVAVTALTVFALLAVPIGILWLVMAQPTLSRNTLSKITVDVKKLQQHVSVLSEQYAPRDYNHTENLNLCAAYILEEFKKAGARSPAFQTFSSFGKEYKNVIGHFGPQSQERIIVGAHYDAYGVSPGADDNASGVAGLIELASLLARKKLPGEVDLVAYSIEEPPVFGTDHMGSAYHAEALAKKGITVKLMISLEMIGYFSDQAGSQSFPMPLLNLFYPRTGNFISLVSRLDQRKIVRTIKNSMKGATALPVYSFNAPASVPGIDFSDHKSYWKYGWPALMVTDTAFYRNTAYHGFTDTADKLDYGRMAQVVVGVYEAVIDFLEHGEKSHTERY